MTAFTAAVSSFESAAEHPEASDVFPQVAANSVIPGHRKAKAKQNTTKFRFTEISLSWKIGQLINSAANARVH
jgi:hypothetical protein